MKRHRHTVTRPEALHLAADFDDRPAEFVPGHSRKCQFEPEPGPVVLPQVPIAAANSAGLGLNDRIGRARCWIRQLMHFQGLLVLRNHRASHVILLVSIALFRVPLITNGE